jgi:precorrin-2 dehydrogenase/sirohydrochlorin ferrochelatase
MAGDLAAAREALRAALAAHAGASPKGRICIIDAAGAIDLISLRAARRLAQADILVLGDNADPALIALARRDARRLALGDADLAALAAPGLLIVVTAPPPPAAFAALAEAGIAVEWFSAAPEPS